MRDMHRKGQIDPGAQAAEPAILHQIQPELAEAQARPVVSEIPAENAAQPLIGEA